MSTAVFTPAHVIEAAIATVARDSALPGPIFDPASGVAPEFHPQHHAQRSASDD